jgi:hypothetical protein
MTYACPAWEFAADTHLLKLQHLQNKVLCINGNFQRCTTVCDLHTAFYPSYVYNYITKLCRQQAEVIYKIMRMNMFAASDKAKPDVENIRGLNLVVVKLTTVQVTKYLLLHKISKIGMQFWINS